ncbi:hypothetical protein GMORB2_1596 [Geosmithia morbida]|uniref:Uncharacterized protein n=1 Tax=Geosmithia morbida TaxID=1094350 RepID=A0A9P5D0L8_9HYPO|nr:uncharacterized protein GMORB2_1596 [Geosmithia morbida]KAF4121757.1 hypothetical protein GMORB2_1596 [Geosmithia morbida]
MGLRRDPSHESSTSRRPSSADADSDTGSISLQNDLARIPRKLFAEDPIPESPKTPVALTANEPDLDKNKPSQEEPVAPLSATNANSPPKPSVHESKPKVDTGKEDENTEVPQPAEPIKKPAPAHPPPTASPAPKAPSKATTSAKPSTPAKRVEARPSRKYQATNRTPTTPALSQSSSTPSLRLSASKGAKEHDTGLVKPKPKSPTRPVRLPASLMAPTTSSVSKGQESRQTHSRQSGSLQPGHVNSRAPSRASVAAASTSTKTLRRQPSSLNRSRPSFGPPPKKPSQDPAPKKEVHVDEGFLARMMRPTQASASKVTEKAPVTPPRRPATRPSTSNTERSPLGSVKKESRVTAQARNHTVSPQASQTHAILEEAHPGEATGKAAAEVVNRSEKNTEVSATVSKTNEAKDLGHGEASNGLDEQSTQPPVQPVSESQAVLEADMPSTGSSEQAPKENKVPAVPEEATLPTEEITSNDEHNDLPKVDTPERALPLAEQVIKTPAPVEEFEVEYLAEKLSAVRISPPPEAETDW